LLNQELGKVAAQYRNTKILYIDTYSFLNNAVIATEAGRPIFVRGQAFQFVNATSPACGATPSAIYCPSGTPNGYIFADSLHPTDMAHRALSLQVETELQNWQ
jgi:outer membrane lipase/esterase